MEFNINGICKKHNINAQKNPISNNKTSLDSTLLLAMGKIPNKQLKLG